MRYKVAAVQYEPRFGEKAYNVAALLELTARAAAGGVRLAVLPEMAFTGYCFADRDEVAPLAEVVPGGPTVEAFAQLSAAHGIYVVLNLPEVEPSTGAFYNTSVLVGPEGYVGKYRKTHVYRDETRWARDGDLGIPVFETELGRIGLIICMDLDFVEPARIAALAGADVIACPTNWSGSRASWQARGLENGVYVVCSNRCGEERGSTFCGQAAVVGPDGLYLAVLPQGDGMAVAEVNLEQSTAARAVALARRRPAEYQELLISTHLWHWKGVRPEPPGRPTVIGVGEATALPVMLEQLLQAEGVARSRDLPGLDLMVFSDSEAGPEPDAMAEAARRHNCAVVWGASGQPRVVTADGAVAYGGRVLTLPWGRLGVMTGADLLVPEVARVLAKKAADVIAVPANWTTEQDRFLWFARMKENDTALAVANRAGGSLVYTPVRPFLGASAGASGLAVAVVDTSAEEIRAKEHLRMLHPRWYDPLVTA